MKLLFLLLLFIVAGCEQPSLQNLKSQGLSECTGGLSATINFTANVPNKITATYQKKSSTGAVLERRTVDECSVADGQFFRANNTIIVSFVGFGTGSPELFDLDVKDCETGEQIINAINQAPSPQEKGQMCLIALVSYNH